MMKKKNIYDDASLIKKSLIKDLSDKEQKELDQLLDDQSLQDLWNTRSILPKKLIVSLRKEGDIPDESESYVGLLWLPPCGC